MYNILLMAHRPGPSRASGRPRPMAPQPAGLSHATMIARSAAAPRLRRRRREAAPPASPSPSSG